MQRGFPFLTTKNTNKMNGINYFWSFWQMTSVILLLFMIKLTKSVTDAYNISDTYNITKYEKYNITKNEDYDLEYVPYDKRPETYFTPLIFFLIMVIGLIGNSLLALIIIRNLNLRNVSNMYLLSLVIGDILVRNIYIYIYRYVEILFYRKSCVYTRCICKDAITLRVVRRSWLLSRCKLCKWINAARLGVARSSYP